MFCAMKYKYMSKFSSLIKTSPYYCLIEEEGRFTYCGISYSGLVYSCGLNDSHQLGQASTAPKSLLPKQVTPPQSHSSLNR